MNIYIDRTKKGKFAVEAGGKITLFDSQAKAEAFARMKRGRTMALIFSKLDPLEEEPGPQQPKQQLIDPRDRVKIWVEPVAYEGPKESAYASFRVMWRWRGKQRSMAVFVADPTEKGSDEIALEHAREFAAETLEQIEWEAQ